MEELNNFVNERPDATAVFGYGSGVFKQVGYDQASRPQQDVIFIVDDMKKWHLDNMKMNPKDYSLIGRLHLTASSREKIKGLNKVTYFSNIESQGLRFKYGVIEEEDFVTNLSTWGNLFIVGRFQKPVLEISSNDRVDDAITYNKECALRVACLLSPEVTTKKQLLINLCGLSYYGDTRMIIAENPNKVKNIVEGSYSYLEEMYFNPRNYMSISGDKVFINHQRLLREIEFLPSALVDYLAFTNTDLSNIESVKANILEYIKGRNRKESFYQTLYGLKTNGVLRSIPYAISKIKKKVKAK